MDFRKMFHVKPGRNFRLKDIDPNFHGTHESEEKARKDLERYKGDISTLQRKFQSQHEHSLLIVLQGMDSAGKDGTVWHVMSALDPLSARVADFKTPTPQERSHDFLWRVHAHAPAKGEIAIFNRSHYEDVLIVRVHKMVEKQIWRARYDFINNWEKLLHHDNRTTILKFFLHISKDEQLRRFGQRLDDPARQWKATKADYEERAYWDDYVDAYEDVLNECSTDHAPWYVIPANYKWFRNLAISQILARTMEDLNVALPPPPDDLDEIRALHEAAVHAADRPSEPGKKKKPG